MNMNVITLGSSIKYSFGTTFGCMLGLYAAIGVIGFIAGKSNTKKSQEEES